MLQPNPLQPPRPFSTTAAAAIAPTTDRTSGGRFVSAEDFDGTGILTGVDPCESRYWWMPELYGPQATDVHAPHGQSTAIGWDTDSQGRYAASRPFTPAAA